VTSDAYYLQVGRVGSFLCRSAVSSQEMCYASHGLLSVCVDVAEGKLYHVLTKSSSPKDGCIQTQWVDRLKCNWMNYGRNPPPEKLAISGRFRMVIKKGRNSHLIMCSIAVTLSSFFVL